MLLEIAYQISSSKTIISPFSPANVAWHLCPKILKSSRSHFKPFNFLPNCQLLATMFRPSLVGFRVTISPSGVCKYF